MSEPRILRLALPKGSLQDTTFQLFERAGFQIRAASRSYYPTINDPEIECILIRPQEMARYIEQGVMDCGVTGLDWVLESGADVQELADLRAPWPNYVAVRWVLAVKEGSPFSVPEDLQGKRIAAEVVGMTERYLEKKGIEAKVEFSWGATEVKPPVLADAIVDVTETGSTLRANGLRIIDTLTTSNPQLIANRDSYRDPVKKAKIDQIALLLRGALEAKSRVGIKLNIPKDRIDTILELLPSITAPTVANLYGKDWFAVEIVVSEAEVRDLIPRLREFGAEGIIEYPLNKIV